MKKIISIFIALSFVFNLSVKADEGMWLLTLLNKNYSDMKKQGLQLTPQDIYNVNKSSLKDAIIIFGGYCTGEIISSQGLILTNHHCGYSSIQEHSTVDNDYLKDGFWAMTKAEEIATPNLYASFLIEIKDVTERINSELNDKMTEEQRNEKISEIKRAIKKEAIKGNSYRANVKTFFGGNNFYLLTYQDYDDVRFVGAPPSAIGKFGADTDNWMWPRHTGDFSLFRVYMSPDGNPASYSDKNVPYKPKHYLPVSVKGVEKDDFTMVLGYPGGTTRYLSSFGIAEVMEITNTNRVKIRGIRQEIMLADMIANDTIRIKYASKYSRSSNYWKYSIGQNKGLKKLAVKDKKLATEKQFTQWVNADNARKSKYGNALQLIENAYSERKIYINANQYLTETMKRGAEIFQFAYKAESLNQKIGGDSEKISIEKFQKLAENFYKNYNVSTDKKVTAAMLKLYYENISTDLHPDIFDEITRKYGKDFTKFTDEMFSISIFTSEKRLKSFLQQPDKSKLENDLAYKTALSIYKKSDEIRRNLDSYKSNLLKGQRLFIAGLLEMQKDKHFYPDANFTMRLTYGKVGDYSPKDAVYYDYYTTLQGVMEKEDPNNWEFVVPPKLKELYKAKDYGKYGKDGKMFVCFTSDNDITGGNSGSPVINGNGELIGLAFDGNWEAMSGDIAFETKLQKCINVDIRYVLFIIDKFAGAKHLVDEMKLVE